MYVEFVACYEATRQAEWFKKFILGLRVVDNIEKSLKIYCNNELAVQCSYNNKKSHAAKNINIKYYVVKEKIQDHTISLEHVSYPFFIPKSSTHRTHDLGSIVPHIRLKVFTDNQMSRIKYNYYISNVSKDYDRSLASRR
jgi:hypothetical protein